MRGGPPIQPFSRPRILASFAGGEGIDRVTDALFECGTGEEFIARVRTA